MAAKGRSRSSEANLAWLGSLVRVKYEEIQVITW